MVNVGDIYVGDGSSFDPLEQLTVISIVRERNGEIGTVYVKRSRNGETFRFSSPQTFQHWVNYKGLSKVIQHTPTVDRSQFSSQEEYELHTMGYRNG